MIKKITINFCALLITTNLNSMMEMAVMMGAQQGVSIANEAISQSFQNMGKSLQNDQRNISNSLELFSAQAQSAELKNANVLEKIFSGSLQHINKEAATVSDYTTQMQNYIFKAISIHKEPLYYLIAPQKVAVELDLAFTNGTMYTPAGQIWKNIFQAGDWEYDQNSDSFYQFNNVPLFSAETNPTTNKPEQSTTKATYNSISTEYYTYANSYKIECEITLYQIQYPFFVGLQFNKTRWISGSADSLSCARVIGIYGASSTDIGSYFAEKAPLVLYKNQKNNAPIQLLSPLDQIVQKNVKKQTTLPANLFENIQTEPVTFVLKLITSPEQIVYKLWPKNNPEPKKFVTIKSSSKNLYLYHGIGFMSPGAIAQFKLTKPADIIFSQNAKTDFAQEIEALLSQQ